MKAPRVTHTYALPGRCVHKRTTRSELKTHMKENTG